MAIAFRAVGAKTTLDMSTTKLAQNIALPTGHTTGDLLFLFALADNNSNVLATPSGWTRLAQVQNQTAVWRPYSAANNLIVYYRIDTGSLGSTVTLTYNVDDGWPTGKPEILVFTAAYSGCDSTSPIGAWNMGTTTSTAVAAAHPVEATARPNCWLLTLRTVASDKPGATFTCSVGTDAERFDQTDDIPELAMALYDSNTALTAGVQTQRTTTASRAATYGSTMSTFVIQPPNSGTTNTANSQASLVTATAYDATVQTQNLDWSLCGVGGLPTYSFAVDWNGDGDFTDTGDDITLKITSDVAITYGRDQSRQLNPAAVGTAAFTVINVDRTYSPDWVGSTLYGDLEPAQQTRGQVTFLGVTYPLFWAKIDDFDINADMTNRTVEFSFLDGLSDLQNVDLSTGVYKSLRTGQLINTILDLVGWTGPRDLDLGATIVPYWWVEGTDALSAINDLVKSEGPPAIAYQGPDGTFVFRDRHHRLLRQQSLGVQAVFSQPTLMDCTNPVVDADDGSFDFTAPFTYAHGWRDIVNSVSFSVPQRLESAVLSAVWSDSDQVSVSTGQSITIQVSGSDPFIDAVVPVNGTDFTYTGAGAPVVTLSRTSGATAVITILASGGPVNISGLQLRAKPVTVQNTVTVTRTDADSISRYGAKAYPDEAPWANANDADAIAGMILLQYARRRPTVQLRVTSADPAHFVQVISRTVSDRIHLVYGEMGIDDDYFVESVQHTIQRYNVAGQPPVHAVVLGCEKDFVSSANPFTFDQRGSGFDDGVFDPIQSDDPATVFLFDDPDQGRFDVGKYGT